MKKILVMLILSCLLLQSAMLSSCSDNKQAETIIETAAPTEKQTDCKDSNNIGYTVSADGTLVVADAGDETEIVIPEEYNGKKVTTIGASAFKMSEAKSITIPDTVTEIERFAFGLSTKLEIVNIPEGITTIKAHTFNGCLSLKEIELPKSLETIEIFAFDACAFSEIEIPESVKLIEENAFAECTQLKKIVIRNKDIEIRENVFNRSNKVVIHAEKDSNAIKYAKAHGINYKVI